jgi:1-acyl-sn-glycerol-3-phosphate acyltransferase
LGLLIFTRRIIFLQPSILQQTGPLLLAANHSNSFLDALILGSYFNRPVHFLARGDAFKNPVSKKILTALNVIPIFRLSEGKEYLALNDITFGKCAEILRSGGIVLIFSEGLCKNEWTLRPLKKGTARIAVRAWNCPALSTSLRVLPVSINYSSFDRFRKKVIIHFGQPIYQQETGVKKPAGEQIMELNKLLSTRLEEGLMIEKNDKGAVAFLLSNVGHEKNKQELIQRLKQKQNALQLPLEQWLKKLTGTKSIALHPVALVRCFFLVLLLFIPAVFGYVVNLPLYLTLNNVIKKKTTGTVFYHSVLFGALIIFYPMYAFIVSVVLSAIFDNPLFLSSFLAMPFLAFLFLLWKDCCEKIINYFKVPGSVREEITKG